MTHWTASEATHLMNLVNEGVLTSTSEELGVLLQYRCGSQHLRTGDEVRKALEAMMRARVANPCAKVVDVLNKVK